MQGETEPAGAQQVWDAAQRLKDAVVGMAVGAGNDAARMNATKFLEQLILLYTADVVPPLAKGSAIAPQPLPAANQVQSHAGCGYLVSLEKRPCVTITNGADCKSCHGIQHICIPA